MVAAFVVGGVLFTRYLYERSLSVNARVEIDPLAEEARADVASAKAEGLRIFDGEVVRTALRTREASALALVAGLRASQALAKVQRFPSVEALSQALSGEGLLPPNVDPASGVPGVFGSRYGMLYLRYRVEPLGIEVVSVGKEEIDGPSLIVRLDTSGGETSGAVVLRARQLGEVLVPEPFKPPYQVNPVDWQQELLRESKLAPEEQQNLRAWAAAASNGR